MAGSITGTTPRPRHPPWHALIYFKAKPTLNAMVKSATKKKAATGGGKKKAAAGGKAAKASGASGAKKKREPKKVSKQTLYNGT